MEKYKLQREGADRKVQSPKSRDFDEKLEKVIGEQAGPILMDEKMIRYIRYQHRCWVEGGREK